MSDYRVEFHPKAIEEARQAFLWYQERDAGVARAFMVEIENAVEKISIQPFSRPEYIAGSRRYLFKTFPYSMVYRLREEVLEILAIAHAKRKPGYWATRLRNQ